MRKKGLKILQKWFFVCLFCFVKKKLCIHHETDVYKTNYLLLNIKNLHDFFLNLRYSDFRLHVFPLQSTQRPCFWSECICNYQRQLEFNCFLTFCYINNYIYYNQRVGVKFKSNRLLFFFTVHTYVTS